MASKRTETLVNWDKDHVIHSLAPFGYTSGVVIEEGHGIWLRDTEGKEYIDMTAGAGHCLLGFDRREIIDAIADQMNHLDASHTFFGLSNSKNVECAQKLAQVTPSGMDHLFFCTSGTEASDSAYKIGQLFWSTQGRRKWKTIGFYGGFTGYGATIWAASVGKSAYQEGIGPPAPGFSFVPSFDCDHCMFGLKYPNCSIRCARYVAEVIENEGPQHVSAFMAEPVLGGSHGMVPPPPEYWPMVRRICDEYDILLIADEVQSGFTKSGRMFALENWAVKPDIMSMGKAISAGYLPFGAVAVGEKVFEALRGHPFLHGYTYCGHPAACVASMKAIDIYENEKLTDNATVVGRHVMERLETEFKPLPCVGGYSGIGLMIGVDIVSDKVTKAPLPEPVRGRIMRDIWERGVISRPIAGGAGIRLFVCPATVITIEEMDEILDRILPVLATVAV